jgi:hypothetical protein
MHAPGVLQWNDDDEVYNAMFLHSPILAPGLAQSPVDSRIYMSIPKR